MIYNFGSFELDLAKVEFRENGEPRRIEPQVFALLGLLIEHRDRLVSKEEIFQTIWDGRVVTDSALSTRVKSARKLLHDDGRSQKYIKTIHGQGLRFVAEVNLQRDPAIGLRVAVDDAEGLAADATGAPEPNSRSRPSIAVLPFRAIGDVGSAATIADGIPHELITELARLRWFFVVARGSSFRFRGEDVGPCEVGHLLNVDYCLAGTVEVLDKRLTVAAELVDTRDGDIVWAERYSNPVEEVHAMRADIRDNILSSLEIQIPLHEAANARLRDPDNLDAWSAYHLGLQHIYRFSRKDNAIAAQLFRQAVDKDPGFARAHAGLSFVHFQTAFMRHAGDLAAETALARSHAQHGFDIDPLDPFVNFTMGRSYWLEGDLDRALSWLERSTALSPNYAQGIYARAWTEIMAGNAPAARQHLDLAMRLSPLDPLYYAMLSARGLTHIEMNEDAEAAEWADRGARAPGAHPLIAMIASAAQTLAGNRQRGMKWADDARARNPALTREDFFSAFPMQSQATRARVSFALKSAGFH